ncbi:hypothetical protein FKW77_000935 [Venturia effusa]|uniref:AAA+ ATPase domain-containing protein n=1 Tax=Venturia effusa TaxID=50376 RepID=A0A517L6K2_9PEZI|nr:hypothetical protein FKW77_000935 [Venturia effusa]
MMRAKPANAMQKTYDDCYLVCSTAVYFESQGNESEALRSWRNALDQIYYHNAYRMPSNYTPKSETEKALFDSLKSMELQCKERVDLLEALKSSRDEASMVGKTSSRECLPPPSPPRSSNGYHQESGGAWLGEGSVPPMDYTYLTRPPLPIRPAVPTRMKSGGSDGPVRKSAMPLSEPSLPTLIPATSSPQPRKSRTPSPEKRTMLRSLRPPGKERASSSTKASQSPRRPNGFVASAASQAWTSTASKVEGNGVSMPLTASSRLTQTPPVDKTRKSLDSANALSYRSEYPAPQTRNKIASHEAIETARRRHGLGRPSRSPPRSPKPDLGRDNFGDDYVLPRPNETRRMKSNRSSVENDNPRSPPTPPTPRVSRRPLPGSSNTRDPVSVSSSKPRPPRRSHGSQSSMADEASGGRRSEAKSRVPVSVDTSSSPVSTSDDEDCDTIDPAEKARQSRINALMKKVPKGVDEAAAKQIFNEIVVHGDEVHWDDIAGLDIAKDALKETVVYPFLRPDLFMGLREPARGMLLFGPPGTGKTMLARAVATESKSTFFAISASSLTSKFLGESEKLVRALFGIAKAMAPSIIFVDEIDSLLSARGDSGEHEATRRIKTEFLIQWSDLARAAAGREQSAQEKERGDASRVLVLAATNLPWAIDEAARRRFVRRQYIPLPEDGVRGRQLRTLLGAQKHGLGPGDIERLVALTEGFSGSDITYLAKDAAMGPLRSLGDRLLNMTMEDIRPIEMKDFLASLKTIRPSVSKQGMERFEEWAREFGERGG